MIIPTTPVLANIMGPQGLFILFVLLLLFGAKKLPELARGLGQAIREFSKAKSEITDEIMRESVAPHRQIETPVVQTTTPQPAAAPQTVAQAPANDSGHPATHA